MNSLDMAKLVVSLIDLTSLNLNDTPKDIENLCISANTPVGSVASVCIYPKFIKLSKELLEGTDIKVATVTNFPKGSSDIDMALLQTKEAIELGADEIDVVFPYKALIDKDEEIGYKLVQECKRACGEDIVLKVIIESGMLDKTLIQKASTISIEAGADFIKTSTGKVAKNATLEAAKIMLEVIKSKAPKSVGFKASGGIRDFDTAMEYILLASEIMGRDWIDKDHFRFGASSLLSNVLTKVGYEHKSSGGGY